VQHGAEQHAARADHQLTHPRQVVAADLAGVADDKDPVHPVGQRDGVGVGQHGGGEHHDDGALGLGVADEVGGGR
jgi:hypothetical protein